MDARHHRRTLSAFRGIELLRRRNIPRPRVRFVLAVIALLPICAILCVTYFLVIPFLTGFDSCLSTLLAPNDIAAIRIRYEAFYDLVKRGKYEEAYEYTSVRYRQENDLEEFNQDVHLINQGYADTELRPDSSISVCGDYATLAIGGVHQWGWVYGGFDGLSRAGGQWYFDWIRYSSP